MSVIDARLPVLDHRSARKFPILGMVLVIFPAVDEVDDRDGMIPARRGQCLDVRALLHIARQTFIEVADGATEQMLLAVVVCVETRAA